MAKVLLNTLEDFNIKYNIKRYLFLLLIYYLLININNFYSITRDNTLFNNILISSFIKVYNLKAIKF